MTRPPRGKTRRPGRPAADDKVRVEVRVPREVAEILKQRGKPDGLSLPAYTSVVLCRAARS